MYEKRVIYVKNDIGTIVLTQSLRFNDRIYILKQAIVIVEIILSNHDDSQRYYFEIKCIDESIRDKYY